MTDQASDDAKLCKHGNPPRTEFYICPGCTMTDTDDAKRITHYAGDDCPGGHTVDMIGAASILPKPADTDDATIEEARRKAQETLDFHVTDEANAGLCYECYGSTPWPCDEVVLAKKTLLACDIATRRGEEIYRRGERIRDWESAHQSQKERADFAESERDALAEENKILRDQLKEVAEALCDCDSHMRDGHHYGDCPLGTAQIDALAALSGGTE